VIKDQLQYQQQASNQQQAAEGSGNQVPKGPVLEAVLDPGFTLLLSGISHD
jgi:hypothetical protein